VPNAPGGAVISAFAWIAIGVAAWLAVAALVGVLIGRMIRGRDRQVPKDAPVASGSPRIPAQGTTPEQPAGPPAPRQPDQGRSSS
jgi:hypothetical protein